MHIYICHISNQISKVSSKDFSASFVLNVSTSLNDIQPCIDIAKTLGNTYTAIGIHPHDSTDAFKTGTEYLDILEKTATKVNRVIAIGEIGLDYYRNISSVDVQKKVFADQVALALHLKLPIILTHQGSIR